MSGTFMTLSIMYAKLSEADLSFTGSNQSKKFVNKNLLQLW